MKFTGTAGYVATDDLKVAVNAAITLQRPLLIKGEPGTGKSVLAQEVAKALGTQLIEWHIKSTTKAHQGLYEYDAVSRLRDSQLGDARVGDIKNYIRRGKLWEAFTRDQRMGDPDVVTSAAMRQPNQRMGDPDVVTSAAMRQPNQRMGDPDVVTSAAMRQPNQRMGDPDVVTSAAMRQPNQRMGDPDVVTSAAMRQPNQRMGDPDVVTSAAMRQPTIPPVLLIDEIDKADIEFPNDLLQELDRMEFFVYETGETIKASIRPVVLITSNNEKELPDAFLRRCFFHYIKFPDPETMKSIVEVHFPGLKQRLVAEALRIFYDVRDVPGIKKKPSTSELLDWIKLLLNEDISPETLREQDPRKLIPPLHGALLKNEQDIHLFERLAFLSRRKGE